MRGGDAVIHALEQEGVRYIAGVSGGGLQPLWPALKASETLRAFTTRHERLGVEIADGYARATGDVGVAMTGTGPGATNTLTGMVFTWEFSRNCHSFVTVPVSVLPAIETDMAWLQYVTGNDYISTLVDNALEHVTILDINQLLGLSGSIIARHRNLAAQANVEGPFYVKVHIENVWRTTPFVDIPSYLAHISEYHFPVVQDSDIVIPDGVSEEAFIRISERNPSSETISFSGGSEGFTLSDLFSISMPILNALGIPLREVVDGKEQELIDLVKRVHKPRIAG